MHDQAPERAGRTSRCCKAGRPMLVVRARTDGIFTVPQAAGRAGPLLQPGRALGYVIGKARRWCALSWRRTHRPRARSSPTASGAPRGPSRPVLRGRWCARSRPARRRCRARRWGPGGRRDRHRPARSEGRPGVAALSFSSTCELPGGGRSTGFGQRVFVRFDHRTGSRWPSNLAPDASACCSCELQCQGRDLESAAEQRPAGRTPSAPSQPGGMTGRDDLLGAVAKRGDPPAAQSGTTAGADRDRAARHEAALRVAAGRRAGWRARADCARGCCRDGFAAALVGESFRADARSRQRGRSACATITRSSMGGAAMLQRHARRDGDRRGQDHHRRSAGRPRRAGRLSGACHHRQRLSRRARRRATGAALRRARPAASAWSCMACRRTSGAPPMPRRSPTARNKELVFDYLRDRMALAAARSRAAPAARQAARRPGARRPAGAARAHFAIVDEADSVLIDEARTPLILSRRRAGGGDGASRSRRWTLARRLDRTSDYDARSRRPQRRADAGRARTALAALADGLRRAVDVAAGPRGAGEQALTALHPVPSRRALHRRRRQGADRRRIHRPRHARPRLGTRPAPDDRGQGGLRAHRSGA